MSSSARCTSSSEKSVAPFRKVSDARFQVEALITPAGNTFTASSFEFVAKPEQARNAVQLLPAEIHSGLEDLAGFAGSLVMVSDEEARLITVIIFWHGSEARNNFDRGTRRVRALLAPYLDRCLRSQNLFAHFPQPEPYSQAGSIDTSLIAEDSIAQEANVCAA